MKSWLPVSGPLWPSRDLDFWASAAAIQALRYSWVSARQRLATFVKISHALNYLRRPLSPRIENWTGALCGPFCGRRTSGWRTSFDWFERAGRRLCLPGRALAAAPAPNSPPCQPCLTLSGPFHICCGGLCRCLRWHASRRGAASTCGSCFNEIQAGSPRPVPARRAAEGGQIVLAPFPGNA